MVPRELTTPTLCPRCAQDYPKAKTQPSGHTTPVGLDALEPGSQKAARLTGNGLVMARRREGEEPVGGAEAEVEVALRKSHRPP